MFNGHRAQGINAHRNMHNIGLNLRDYAWRGLDQGGLLGPSGLI